MILSMGLSISPEIWQHYIDWLFKNIENRKRHKIMTDDAMVSPEKISIWYGKSFKALIRFGLKISPHKCNFSQAI